MTTFIVKLTNQTKTQIAETVDYIAHKLDAATTARNFSYLIENELNELSYMPERHMLIKEEPWHTKGIRKLLIKKFYCLFLDKQNRPHRVGNKFCIWRKRSIGSIKKYQYRGFSLVKK